MCLIKLSDVSKIYGFGDATTVALDEVHLEIDRGEFVAIMGPSGSGKSTLMNIIGLLDRPTHGQYILGDHPAARLRSNQRAKMRRDKIGFVFQSFNLIQRLTALENVALPLSYKGMSPIKRLKRAGEMLERVGLADKEYYTPRQLSGGQLQRVAIARALVNNPDIVIADEPTGNLDSQSSRMVMELLSDVHKAGHTILLVTHNPELTRYVNRVVYMHDGAIIHDERTPIGEVPQVARTALNLFQRKTEEDDLAGVSVLMSALAYGRREKAVPAVRRTAPKLSRSAHSIKVKEAKRGRRGRKK